MTYFVCLTIKKKPSQFLSFLNKQRPNIKFTDEPEKNGSLPFLDVTIKKREGGGFNTSVYHKPSYTGLLTNFPSYIPSLYKSALAKTLIHRCFKICNTWDLFHKNIKELEHTLKRNKFPPRLIRKEINFFWIIYITLIA